MPNIGGAEMLIVLLVVLLLFGSAKLPQLARSLGRSARILKAETKGLHSDDEQPAQPQQAPAAAPQPAPQQQPYQQGQLPPGEPIQGVPVSDPNRRSS